MPLVLDRPARAPRERSDEERDDERAEPGGHDGPSDDDPPDDDNNGGNGGNGGNDGDDDDEGEDPGPSGPARWVTIATFWQPTDAHLARLRIEAEGIDCVILDENLVATDWLYANAVGGIKLQVPSPHAARARDLLRATRAGVIALADGQPVSDGQALCPRCGSDDIYPVRLSRRLALVSILLLGLPLPLLLRRVRCAACGFEWK